MKPNDPFEQEQLDLEIEAFEYSGQGQFLGKKFEELTEQMADAIESVRREIEEGRYEEKPEATPDLLEGILEQLIAAHNILYTLLGITLIAFIGNWVLLAAILWRSW